MNEIQVLRHIAGELNRQIASYATSCSGGSAKDFAEYKYLCGLIRGLGIAIESITDLAQKMERSDD